MEASDKMIEASGLIKDALHMSGIEERGRQIIDTIEHYTSLNGESCSIPNIILDLEASQDDPCWTRPLVSVKQSDRKDI